MKQDPQVWLFYCPSLCIFTSNHTVYYALYESKHCNRIHKDRMEDLMNKGNYFNELLWPQEYVSEGKYVMNEGIEPRLTRNFTCREFMCHCCGVCRMQAELMYALQTLRDLAGEPIRVVSGYRCRKHNINVGGAEFSYHMKGMAADIVIAKHSIAETISLAHKVDAFKHGGIGCYNSWVHVDIGPERRWSK